MNPIILAGYIWALAGLLLPFYFATSRLRYADDRWKFPWRKPPKLNMDDIEELFTKKERIGDIDEVVDLMIRAIGRQEWRRRWIRKVPG